MSISNGQFLDLNDRARLERQHPSITKLRPGVVRRNNHPEPEPDRSMIEGFVAKGLGAEAAVDSLLGERRPQSEAREMAAKKKARKRLSDGDKKIAIARVAALVKAGEELRVSARKVAKEFGVSPLSLERWTREARRSGESEPPRAGKKKRAARRVTGERTGTEGYPVGTPMPTSIAGERFLALIDGAIEPTVRRIVREEIRRMLS